MGPEVTDREAIARRRWFNSSGPCRLRVEAVTMSELPGQLDMFGNERTGSEEYDVFVEKFKAKKTTDDCYTPENVYEAVAEWVRAEYGVERADMVRPFWPGGDYVAFDYPAGCCVVDNPPFSLLSRIMRFYLSRGIRFFLFAPTLTLFVGRGIDVSYLPCGAKITYENGANINTSFVTNLDTCRLRSVPKLYRIIKRENEINEKAVTKKLPRYKYPDHVLTAAAAYQYSHYGIDFRVEKGECRFIDKLDAMRGIKDSGIFGGALLMNDRKAAERAVAERAAAERAAAERADTVWKLSDRERDIVKMLGG